MYIKIPVATCTDGTTEVNRPDRAVAAQEQADALAVRAVAEGLAREPDIAEFQAATNDRFAQAEQIVILQIMQISEATVEQIVAAELVGSIG